MGFNSGFKGLSIFSRPVTSLGSNAVAALLVCHQFWDVITRSDVNGTTMRSATSNTIITLVPSL